MTPHLFSHKPHKRSPFSPWRGGVGTPSDVVETERRTCRTNIQLKKERQAAVRSSSDSHATALEQLLLVENDNIASMGSILWDRLWDRCDAILIAYQMSRQSRSHCSPLSCWKLSCIGWEENVSKRYTRWVLLFTFDCDAYLLCKCQYLLCSCQ